ncbi:MAG: hypothetical protein A2233_02045 [Candidatus Kerfeldbacteria bacterium RIFOXYA2_FULL_38_24]|uniref:Uncharacterized protein n=1 Tax=Candidatus Kerfeldbacteria bacterium RIFOXYB2_FULL_38_14 TaxID=1798547 RepID=A0A1G2BHL2_9BACT|nr:MAG: hypothetical protein A2319_04645 [Candidatus Kerfeldbacteria bacterium RIFOXYB2_FULL_38_14]OGY87897.1 MAG: hypothetical protein A2233_02045 [Candidatus Kerfeldbacteria bacterium RIFOXYA2_FULL_38_24]OGY88688.1 MAG: hypothetical protein A2458_03560 [Candidatus Kerfeldbacteria bacterium RIFOXYC2_FULL_38_9]
MSTLSTIGLISFLICLFLGRFLNEKALQVLNKDEKIKLMDGFSKMRKYNLIPIIIFTILIILLGRTLQPVTNFIIFILLWIILIAVTHMFLFSKLKSLQLSDKYIKKIVLAQIIKFLGVGIFIVASISYYL